LFDHSVYGFVIHYKLREIFIASAYVKALGVQNAAGCLMQPDRKVLASTCIVQLYTTYVAHPLSSRASGQLRIISQTPIKFSFSLLH